MNVRIETEHLIIKPYEETYLESYYKEFTEEITRYQYPDAFPDIESARQLVSEFVADMKQGLMLELVILNKEEEFLGSMEAFGLKEKSPEVGLWLKKSAHGHGYGYEALKALVSYLKDEWKFTSCIYEVDVRNEASLHLVKKFSYQLGGREEIVTESGKQLSLQTYFIQ